MSVFQSSNCTAIAMYFNFSEKLKFTKVFVLFHKFFFTWITTAGYQNKKRSISSKEK